MKLSVITVCRNSVATLADTLASVRMQKGVEFEHIVVDGASADGTLELLRVSPQVLWRSEPDGGMYDALNKGISLATGDVVGILNADDLFENDHCLRDVAAAFSPETDAVCADVRFVAQDLRTTLRVYSAKHWSPWMFRWGKMPPHPGVYIRRECFARLGAYKTDYEIAADYELLIRYLLRGGLRFRRLGSSIVRMRMGGKSTRSWRSNLLLNREIVRANRENGCFCCLPMLLPKYLFKIWEFILPRLSSLGAKRLDSSGGNT